MPALYAAMRHATRHLATLVPITLFILLLWQMLIIITGVQPFILPPPLRVLQTLYFHAGSLFYHLQFTLIAMISGLILGVILGFASGLTLTVYKKLGRFLLPLFVLSQALPVFALAPLLVLWLGFGLASKIAMATLIIYFPVTSATFDGLRHYPKHLLALETTLGGKPLQNLWLIRIPAALPSIASGIRIAAACAPIGAIVGEWVGSARGIGFIMLHANARMETDIMFAALALLAFVAIVLYKFVDKLLSLLIFWENNTMDSSSSSYFVTRKGEKS